MPCATITPLATASSRVCAGAAMSTPWSFVQAPGGDALWTGPGKTKPRLLGVFWLLEQLTALGWSGAGWAWVGWVGAGGAWAPQPAWAGGGPALEWASGRPA